MLPVLLALSLAQTPTTYELKWDPRVDLPVTATLGVAWLVSEFAVKRQLSPADCRWCATNDFDNGVRGLFVPSLSPSASGLSGPDMASNIIGFAALPVAMLGLNALIGGRDEAWWKRFLIDTVLVLEATFAAINVNQLVKFTVGRARPYTVGADEALLAERHPEDHNLSFFSGHATFVFALATSAATVATLRGYRHAWLLWVVGQPLAAATALLRLAADKHWASDVILGTLFGQAVGVLMPTLLHGRVGPVELQAAPMPNGLAVSGRF